MKCLGIRCSNTDYVYAIVDGTRESPKVLDENTVSFPKEFTHALSLKWFYQEIDALIKRYNVCAIVIKGAESMASRDKNFVFRTENEAMIFLAAANSGVEDISRKVKSTLAKDLGGKGKAKYLLGLDTTMFPNFQSESTKMQEAILSAWSMLK